jgi:SPP1 family predicted phage head-tail adaptor
MLVSNTNAPLQAGDMDQIVALQTLSATKDAFGQRETWVTLTMCAARCLPLSGGDFLAAGAMQNPVSLLVQIYWRPHLPADVRVLWRGTTYQTTAAPVDVDGRRFSLDLMCIEVPK